MSKMDPFNYPFPQKSDTMNLSTINQNDVRIFHKIVRESSFQVHDINGSVPKKLIPDQVHKSNFSLSTKIQPKNTGYKKIEKISDPLKIDDIEGTRPQAVNFITRRVVNPLSPVYKLPSYGEINASPEKKFLRDTLNVNDIAKKKQNYFNRNKGVEILNQQIKGSKPLPRTHTLNTLSTLHVTDINKDGIFTTNRSINPLNPVYVWRDDLEKLNLGYGKIEGNSSNQRHPITVNKQNNFCLGIQDIEGSSHNSCFENKHFLQKRRQIRNYMKTNDIEKASSSSLKKGIISSRIIDPLIPRYKYPGQTQIMKV